MMKVIICWTGTRSCKLRKSYFTGSGAQTFGASVLIHSVQTWNHTKLNKDVSVDWGLAYAWVTDCLLPTVFLHYFWPDNHSVWLKIREDLHCFMSEIIFNISKSLWTAKLQGFFLFWLLSDNMQNRRRVWEALSLSFCLSVYVLKLPTQVQNCLHVLNLVSTMPFSTKR